MKTKTKSTENDTEPRIRELYDVLSKALEARGHKAGKGWASFEEQSLRWTIYEPSTVKKIPLTKKQLEDRFSVTEKARERGWSRGYEPSGSLALVIDAEFRGQTRIADTRAVPLENR